MQGGGPGWAVRCRRRCRGAAEFIDRPAVRSATMSNSVGAQRSRTGAPDVKPAGMASLQTAFVGIELWRISYGQ